MFSAYYLLPGLSEGGREIGALSSFLLIPQEYKSPALSVSWTLMHELLFYAVFSVFYIRKKLLLVFSLIWAACILIYPLFQQRSFFGDFLLNMHNIQFLLGMMLSYAFFNYKSLFDSVTKNKILPGFMLTLSIVFITCIVFNRTDLSYFLNEYYTFLVGVAFVVIIISLLMAENSLMLCKIFKSKTLLFLGSASYSIYLFHNPVISILNRVAVKVVNIYPSLNSEFVFMFIAGIAILGGVAYYLLWEKPVLSIMKRNIYPYVMKNVAMV